MADERYRGWTRPGPPAAGGVDVEDGETLDFLCGHWRIFQYERGHRYSSDDVLCAFYASTWAPRVERALDLGSGIGSVAMTVAWRLPGARFVTVEAQPISIRLARKTARHNGVDDRFTFLEGDLRDDDVLATALATPTATATKHGPNNVRTGGFDLVTGSPPYWPVGTALASAHPQAVPARLEVRGDINDYAKAASKLLAPGGVFACVFQASQDVRVRRALHDAGLVLLRKRDVVFKEGASLDESGATVYLAARRADVPTSSFPGDPVGQTSAGSTTFVDGKPVVEPPLVIRRADGSTSPEYATVRLSFGFPPGDVGPNDER